MSAVPKRAPQPSRLAQVTRPPPGKRRGGIRRDIDLLASGRRHAGSPPENAAMGNSPWLGISSSGRAAMPKSSGAPIGRPWQALALSCVLTLLVTTLTFAQSGGAPSLDPAVDSPPASVVTRDATGKVVVHATRITQPPDIEAGSTTPCTARCRRSASSSSRSRRRARRSRRRPRCG